MESTNRTREDRLQKETKSKSERSIRAMVQTGESNPMTTGVIASVKRNRQRSQCGERRCGKKKEKEKRKEKGKKKKGKRKITKNEKIQKKEKEREKSKRNHKGEKRKEVEKKTEIHEKLAEVETRIGEQ